MLHTFTSVPVWRISFAWFIKTRRTTLLINLVDWDAHLLRSSSFLCRETIWLPSLLQCPDRLLTTHKVDDHQSLSIMPKYCDRRNGKPIYTAVSSAFSNRRPLPTNSTVHEGIILVRLSGLLSSALQNEKFSIVDLHEPMLTMRLLLGCDKGRPCSAGVSLFRNRLYPANGPKFSDLSSRRSSTDGVLYGHCFGCVSSSAFSRNGSRTLVTSTDTVMPLKTNSARLKPASTLSTTPFVVVRDILSTRDSARP
jgi:hypothetical protein